MRRLLYISLIITINLHCKIFAQEYANDAAFWLNIYLEKDITDKINIHLNQQNRINDNFGRYGMGYADVGITYTFNKNFKVLFDYVYAKKLDYETRYTNRHQLYTALVLRKKWGRSSFVYRNMLQLQYEDYYSSADGMIPQLYERNKLTYKFELNKRFTPYLAQELYLPFDQSKHKGLDRSRSFIGLFQKLNKRTTVEYYFLYQVKLNSFSETKRDFVYGLGFSHQF